MARTLNSLIGIGMIGYDYEAIKKGRLLQLLDSTLFKVVEGLQDLIILGSM